MYVDAEDRIQELMHLNEQTGPVFKIKDDPRITKVGKFIPKTSLDELPQLINVLKGEMSLVGPRPAIPREVKLYNDYQMQRLLVKPEMCIRDSVEAVNLEEIYDETKLEFKEARIQAIGDIGIIILSLGASIGAVARFIYMKQEEINSLEHDKDREGLTKTLTKKSLYQRLQAYIGQGNEFTFIVLQYDHFKRYNEVYGYLSGDELSLIHI